MQENAQGKNFVIYFDILNVTACLCVIGMHVNSLVHRFSDTPAWRGSLAVDTLAYWAVPVFFMISGANLMGYRSRYSTKTFFKRRLLKIVIPLVIWIAFFFVWELSSGRRMWTGGREFLSQLLSFGIPPEYWFFAPLLLVYLTMPVLSRLADDKRLLWYMAGLGFATEAVLPFLCSVAGVPYWNSLLFVVTSNHLIFPILGYLLHNTELKPAHRGVIYALGIIGALARYGHTLMASVRDDALNRLTWGNTNWPSIFLAVAIFVLFKYACRRIKCLRTQGCAKVFRWLSGASFGIYLIHIFVLEEFVSILQIDTVNGLWRGFGAFAVYGVALVIIKLLQKIPYVGKYLVP